MSNQLPPEPDTCQDLGKLVKENLLPFFVHEIVSAEMKSFYGLLELKVVIIYCAPRGERIQCVQINCVKTIDYSLRPKPPSMLEGGRLMEYYEEHPMLTEKLQYMPHNDDREKFNPPIKFTLLKLEDSYVIAERFDMLTIHSPSSA